MKNDFDIVLEKNMALNSTSLRTRVTSLVADWKSNGVPSRAVLEKTAEELLTLREAQNGVGLWKSPPLMATATIDDGLGQGLMIIHKYAEAVGIRLLPLGLMQAVDTILSRCREEKPDYLGMTILQFDSEEELSLITGGLPHETKVICGGPVFISDSDFARRCGVHFVARHVGVFLEILLTLS